MPPVDPKEREPRMDQSPGDTSSSQGQDRIDCGGNDVSRLFEVNA
jgi:hypothetical protein